MGSNSVLLLVAERRGTQWEPVHEATEVTALGAGTKSTGRLGEESMQSTLAALARFFADAEALYSYEGTREMNTLIVGRAITGESAFV